MLRPVRSLPLRAAILLAFALALRALDGAVREETWWTLAAAGALLLLAALAVHLLRRRRTPERGMFAMSFLKAVKKAAQARHASREPQRGVYFGGVLLPEEAATSHMMLVGSTGSGKTLNLRMLLGSVLPRLLDTPDQRALIFDEKQDAVSHVRGILRQALQGKGLAPGGVEAELDARILITNPFDGRCAEWAIHRDIDEPELALQMATILIPVEQSPNRYFSDAARDLVAGVMSVFVERAEAWTLADLLYALRSPERLAHVLAQSPEGADLIELHLMGETTTRSVLSTLRSKLAPFDVPATLWRHAGAAGRQFSLGDFLQRNQVLILGNYQAARAPIQAINRLLFNRLAELILGLSEDERRRNWIVLDEVRKMGKLDALDDLMTNGRSKGAAVVLGFQDVEGMRSVYGREEAGEITSMPATFGVLRVSGAETPRWASELMGEQEVLQSLRSRSDTLGDSGVLGNISSTSGQSEQLREKKVFLPSAFRTVPQPERGRPLYGYFCSAFLGSQPYLAEIPPDEVERRLPPRDPAAVDFQPWPKGTPKRLPTWTDADYDRLGIPALPDDPDAAPPSVPAGRGGVGRTVLIDPFASPQNRPLNS